MPTATGRRKKKQNEGKDLKKMNNTGIGENVHQKK